MMLDEEIKQNSVNENDKKVVDDIMGELESLEAKVKSNDKIKHNDEDVGKRKKKRHHHSSPSPKRARKKSRYDTLSFIFLNFSLTYSHKTRKHRRHSSSGSSRSNSRTSTDSDHSFSPKHHRSSKKSRHHNRNDSPPRRKRSSPIPTKPEAGSIYDGTVISIMKWGCFVRLNQFRNQTEGLVHISNVNKFVLSGCGESSCNRLSTLYGKNRVYIVK